jgi:hypothetical protein
VKANKRQATINQLSNIKQVASINQLLMKNQTFGVMKIELKMSTRQLSNINQPLNKN